MTQKNGKEVWREGDEQWVGRGVIIKKKILKDKDISRGREGEIMKKIIRYNE